MTVWDLDANMTSGTAKGKIDIGEFSAMYDLEYHLMDDYMVVTSIEFTNHLADSKIIYG